MFALALMIRGYVHCPYWDEWDVLRVFAHNDGRLSWQWLWSPHNEHRAVVPRLLMWLDVYAFGAQDIFLLCLIFLVQAAHWLVIALTIERSTLPTTLSRGLQGLFAFCLFHPNQLDNFTQAFQISFVMPFFLATLAFAFVCGREDFDKKPLLISFVALVPLLASMNLASGLLVGPAIVCLCLWKHCSRRVTAILTASSLLTIAIYLHNFPTTGGSTFGGILQQPVLRYVFSYFAASWWGVIPHLARTVAAIGVIVFLILAAFGLRRGPTLARLEFFFIVEGGFILLTAMVTAIGRAQMGVGQATSGRYQTPAMIFWAALFSLALLQVARAKPQWLPQAQAALLLIVLTLGTVFPAAWRNNRQRSALMNRACDALINGGVKSGKSPLYSHVELLDESVRLLKRQQNVR